MKGKKILKIIGIILLILFVLLLVHTFRNYIIVSSLQNKISKYANSTNYHVKITTYGTKEKNDITTMNYYKKDDKVVVIAERNMNGEISKISTYNHDNRTDTFIEGKEEKIAQIGERKTGIVVQIYNLLENDTRLQTFLACVFAHIRSEKIDNKECYIVSKYYSNMGWEIEGKNERYIDKETGLLIKNITDDTVTEREFEFNNVSDDVFIEPDIGQYTILKK